MAYRGSAEGEETPDLVQNILNSFLSNGTNKFEQALGKLNNNLGQRKWEINGY
jgi:hypothetical protein